MAARIEPRRIGFDIEGFVEDLQRVCFNRGVSLTRMAREIGVNDSAISYMKTRKSVPDGINLAALCAWSGLNAGLYSKYIEDLT